MLKAAFLQYTNAPVAPLSADQIVALLSSMTEGLYVQGKNGEVVHFNPAVLSIVGMTEAQLLGKVPPSPGWRMVNEWMNELELEEFPASLARRTAKPQLNIVIGIYRSENDLRWVEATAIPLPIGGEPEQVLCTLKDVTEARRAHLENEALKKRLHDREHFLEATLSALPCLVSYIDHEFVYQYANETYREWFGTPPEQLIGKEMRTVIGDAAFELAKPFIVKGLSGEPQRFHRQLPYLRGGTRSVLVTYSPDLNSEGKTIGLYSVVQDVTAELQAAQELEKKENFLQKIIDGVPALIGYWDRDIKNVHANKNYAKYFGKEPAAIKGQHMSEVIGHELFERNATQIAEVLAGNPQIFERSLKIITGEMKSNLVSYIPDISGDVVNGFFVVITDISELKKLESDRREMEMKLVSSSKMKSLGEIAGGVAHEINNPLAIISGLTNRMKDMVENDKYDRDDFLKRFLKIEATLSRTARIVNGLMVFSGDANQIDSMSTPVARILRDTTDLCQEKFRYHGVELEIVNATSEETAVMTRPTEVTQILVNLLGNALDAIRLLPAKWIRLEVSLDQAQVVFLVVDSGTGIPHEVAEKIMQPFFTTKDVGMGTGLGLSISKGLAEQNGGSLKLKTDSDHTTFELMIPQAVSTTVRLDAVA